MIQVFTPGLSVTLTRLVNRTGGSSGPAPQPFKQVDLTPFLGTGGSVRTIADINQPAGGFSVTFADRMHPDYMETVYALVEPQDLVEIRASRTPERYQGTVLPLIMRGFVTTVDRAEAVAQDGDPQRRVTISGQNMGKLLLINHIYFEVAVIQEGKYLLNFHLQAATGMKVEELSVNEFMHQLVERVINLKIEQLSAFADTQIKPFTVDASVPTGSVTVQMLAPQDEMTVWDLAEFFADRTWNELFVQDYEDGPHLVFRPAPYRDLQDRSYIIPGAVDPGTITLDIADVVAITVARTDSRVANFFWVPPTLSLLNSNAQVTANALIGGTPLDFSYDNNSPVLFGVRKMTAQSNLYPTGPPINMLAVGARAEGVDSVVNWYLARMELLKKINRDNSAFEEGGMVVKGSEDYLIGHYLQLTRGDIVGEAYITQVAHNFLPLQVWTTSQHFIRGTGFVDRKKAPTSAYISEGRKGPYSK